MTDLNELAKRASQLPQWYPIAPENATRYVQITEAERDALVSALRALAIGVAEAGNIMLSDLGLPESAAVRDVLLAVGITDTEGDGEKPVPVGQNAQNHTSD